MSANHSELEKLLWASADSLRANSKLRSSEYFTQSIEDGVTVPLYYENRIPELQLINADFNADMEQVIEEAGLDEQQEQRLEREFAREYHLFTNDDRLEKIAQDIVTHFMNRGQLGKAMVVSIDKMTAVRMYDKVQKHWWRYRDELQHQLTRCRDEIERQIIAEKIDYMNETNMAVVVSQDQNEIEDFKKTSTSTTPIMDQVRAYTARLAKVLRPDVIC